MDRLLNYHSVDIQWGNHDVLWMGAAAGQQACIANVIRICARYGNLDILEDGYGINLLPLATFALRMYKDDPCSCFSLKGPQRSNQAEMETDLRMHKAISVIQFKIEGQTIRRHPEFGMEERALLHRIDHEKGTVTLDGKEYPMQDMNKVVLGPPFEFRPIVSSREKRMCIRSGCGGPFSGMPVHDALCQIVGVRVGVSAVDDFEPLYGEIEYLLLHTVHMDTERVGCDGQTSLFVYDVHGLFRRQPFLQFLCQPEAYDLSLVGHDLVADHHVDVIELLGVFLCQDPSCDLVVVGDAEDVEPSSPGIVHLFRRIDDGLRKTHQSQTVESGVVRMDMGVSLSHPFHASW